MQKSNSLSLEDNASPSGKGVPKSLIFGLTIIILASLFSGYLLIKGLRRSSPSVKSPTLTPTEVPEGELVLEDEWGFKVSYPVSLTPTAATKSGELTRWVFRSDTYDGDIAVMSKETNFEDLDSWLKGDTEVQDNISSIDTSLGGELAKKVNLSSPQRVLVATIDNGQLFIVELHPGSDRSMEKAFNRMVASFEFLPFPTVAPSEGSQAGEAEGDISEEGEEEVVE